MCKILPYFFVAVFSPLFSSAQDKNSIDAVAISKTYYNSIVKVLLYDSAYAKISPDKAYLGRGSGFFVTEDGYIFTNRHVINMCAGYYRYTTYNNDTKQQEEGLDVYSPSVLYDASLTKISYVGKACPIVQVYDNDGGNGYTLYYAKIIAVDTANFDGAIIKIVSDLKGNPVNVKFHPVPLGNSDSISQGQDLCLFGFPQQYNGTFEQMLNDLSTLTFGKHSGLDFFYNPQYGAIKTDAVINSGNSGGPVFGPNNKVIGLATAAFNKTNTGLIGGINGMYDLAALIPDLQSALVAKGFSPPKHKPTSITASLYKPNSHLPTKARLRRANHSAKKEGVVNNRILIDFSTRAGVQENGTYQMASAVNPEGISSLGGTIKLAPDNDFGINFRLSMPTLFKQKNNMIGAFFNLSVYISSIDYTSFSSNIYIRDTINRANDFITPQGERTDVHIAPTLGLSYTVLLSNTVSVGLYYGYGIVTDQQNTIGNFNLPNNFYSMGQGGSNTGEVDYNNNNGVSTSQIAGFIFRWRHLVLGAEYRVNSNESFNITTQGSLPGNVTGTLTNRSSISLFLGVTIRPRHRS